MGDYTEAAAEDQKSISQVVNVVLGSLRGCLHDSGATFAPGRVHSGSLSWLYICLHDTTTKCYAGASHPGSRTGARISLRYEISQRYHVNAKRPAISV